MSWETEVQGSTSSPCDVGVCSWHVEITTNLFPFHYLQQIQKSGSEWQGKKAGHSHIKNKSDSNNTLWHHPHPHPHPVCASYWRQKSCGKPLFLKKCPNQEEIVHLKLGLCLSWYLMTKRKTLSLDTLKQASSGLVPPPFFAATCSRSFRVQVEHRADPALGRCVCASASVSPRHLHLVRSVPATGPTSQAGEP